MIFLVFIVFFIIDDIVIHSLSQTGVLGSNLLNNSLLYFMKLHYTKEIVP